MTSADRRQDHGERRQGVEELRPACSRAQAVVVARQHQDHRHLGDLRGLDLHRPEHQPALRAHADLADHVDRDQQQHGDDVDRPGERQPDLGMDQRHHQHQAEGRAVAHRMPRRPRLEAAAGRRIERQRRRSPAIAVSTSTRPQLMRQIFSPKPIGAGASSAKLIGDIIAQRDAILRKRVGAARRIALHGLDQHVAADRARRWRRPPCRARR